MGEYNTGKWALLRKTFAISGMIQGFTWCVLALTCIGMFFKKPKSMKDFENVMISEYTSFGSLLSFCLYDTLLNKESLERNRTLIPANFHIIVWIYAFLSVCWFGLSASEYHALLKKKSRKYGNHVLMTLSFVTLLVCTMDVIVFSLALDDYLKINPFDYSLVTSYDDEDCDFQCEVDLQFRYRIGRKISYGMLVSMAARGFVLWIYNCTAGALSMLMSIRIFQMPPILQYDEIIPRPKLLKKYLISEGDRSSFIEPIYINDTLRTLPTPTERRSWQSRRRSNNMYF